MPKDSIGPDILQRSAMRKAPKAGKVAVVATSGTADVFKIPTEMRGRRVAITADGAAVDFALGASKSMTALVYQQISTLNGTTKVLTLVATSGDHIPSGSTIERYFPDDDAYSFMDHIASGAGFIHIALLE